MKRWWISLALVAGWLGGAATLPAQPFQPSPVGILHMPEPTPTAPSTSDAHVPDLIPGPITAAQAPPGPPDCFSLPANSPSAFQACNFGPDTGVYFDLGIIALERSHLGGPPIVGAGGYGSDVNNPLGLPPSGVTPVYGTNDINQPAHLGMEATLGYFWNGQEIELHAMGIFQNSRSQTAYDPNNLYVPFTNPPQGFGGDNGLWMEADKVGTTFTTSLISPELNYRYSNLVIDETQLILGVRYLSLREKLGITTIDDITTPQDQTMVATYQVQTMNNIIAPQVGFDYEHTFDHLAFITFGFCGKAALGPNFAEIENSLVRGDAYVGFDNHRSSTTLAGIWDLNSYVELNLMERLHLRLGYTAFWVTGISTAAEQVNFDLSNPSGVQHDKGSAFYYGPSVELQFLF